MESGRAIHNGAFWRVTCAIMTNRLQVRRLRSRTADLMDQQWGQWNMEQWGMLRGPNLHSVISHLCGWSLTRFNVENNLCLAIPRLFASPPLCLPAFPSPDHSCPQEGKKYKAGILQNIPWLIIMKSPRSEVTPPSAFRFLLAVANLERRKIHKV